MLTKALWKFQQKGVLCDIILDFTGFQIPMHKVVLAANSSKFADIFRVNLPQNEPGTDCQQVHLHAIKDVMVLPSCVKELMRFLYKGVMHLNDDIVDQVLHVGQILGATAAVDLCQTYSQDRAFGLLKGMTFLHCLITHGT